MNSTQAWRLLLSTLLVALPLLSLVGCVERALLVRSEPSGARIFLDGKDVGSTPARIPFDFYGTRELMIRHEPTERGNGPAYASHTQLVKLSAPWYQWFPIDLFAEFVYPGTLVDEHVVEVTLQEHSIEELDAKLQEGAREHGIEFFGDQKSDAAGSSR